MHPALALVVGFALTADTAATVSPDAAAATFSGPIAIVDSGGALRAREVVRANAPAGLSFEDDATADAAVADAVGSNLRCAPADEQCWRKFLSLSGFAAVLVLTVDGDRLRALLIEPSRPSRRAELAATDGGGVWTALAAPPALAPGPAARVNEPGATASASAPPASSGDGVSPWWLAGAGAAGLSVVGVVVASIASAALAQRLVAARDDRTPIPDDYAPIEGAFYGGAAVGLVAGLGAAVAFTLAGLDALSEEP